MSTAYAQMTVSYAFLLNGGALVALPAFHSDGVQIMASGSGWLVPLSFLLGLFLAFCCAISAHLQANGLVWVLKHLEVGRPAPQSAWQNSGLVGAIWSAGILSYVAFFAGSFLLLSLAGNAA